MPLQFVHKKFNLVIDNDNVELYNHLPNAYIIINFEYIPNIYNGMIMIMY